jgi:hypothetical protein
MACVAIIDLNGVVAVLEISFYSVIWQWLDDKKKSARCRCDATMAGQSGDATNDHRIKELHFAVSGP